MHSRASGNQAYHTGVISLANAFVVNGDMTIIWLGFFFSLSLFVHIHREKYATAIYKGEIAFVIKMFQHVYCDLIFSVASTSRMRFPSTYFRVMNFV